MMSISQKYSKVNLPAWGRVIFTNVMEIVLVYYIIILNRVIFTTVMEIVMVYGYEKG